MKKLQDRIKIIYIVAGIIGVSLPIFLYIVQESLVVTVAGAVVSALLIGLIWFMDYSHNRDNEKQLSQLSELINNLINMKDDLVFSDAEDTLVSKLQSQVIKLNTILRAQNAQVGEERNNIKGLISDISHQIKTPVATLKLYSEFLNEADISKEQREEYLRVLSSSVDKLVFLSESLIKMSRLESGIIEISKVKADVQSLVLGAIKDGYPKAKAKSIELVYGSSFDETINMDIKWTREAIFNIIDNGIKYSPPKSTIQIDLIKYPSYVCINVSDEGMGIKEEDYAKIFQRFYRGKNSADEEGVGIGLYLARKIVTLQGGYIKVKSDEKGSVFSVFLPLNSEF